MKLKELKQIVYTQFKVIDTVELKKQDVFKTVLSSLPNKKLTYKETWEGIISKLKIIQGSSVVTLFQPWIVFSLDPQTATKQDIKKAFYRLSKVYHPDNKETGDAHVFSRLEVMYRSIKNV